MYLKDIIQPGQNAFIKGRGISDKIRLLFDIIDFTEYDEIPGTILVLLILSTGNLCFVY